MLEGFGLGLAYGGAPPLFENLDLAVAPGEIVAVTGPSGSGKTSLGRILAGDLAPISGHVRLNGGALSRAGFSPVQIVSQTPILALDPRWRIGRSLTEGFMPSAALLAELAISADWLERYPHELSGGELQRIALARTLGPRLRYLVADEITGSLDAPTQARIWDALLRHARSRGIGLLVISHDDALIDAIADRRIRLGRPKERGGLRQASR